MRLLVLAPKVLFSWSSGKKNGGQARDEMAFYAVLGLGLNATPDMIKKSYRRLALKYHPDKTGGDTFVFSEVSLAYAVLSNPAKRQVYNSFGQQGVDLFDSLQAYGVRESVMPRPT